VVSESSIAVKGKKYRRKNKSRKTFKSIFVFFFFDSVAAPWRLVGIEKTIFDKGGAEDVNQYQVKSNSGQVYAGFCYLMSSDVIHFYNSHSL